MTDQSTIQTRQRTVFHRDTLADDDGLTAYRAPLTDDRPDVYRMLDLPADAYDAMGRPDVITVTVEPGDLLNVPEGRTVTVDLDDPATAERITHALNLADRRAYTLDGPRRTTADIVLDALASEPAPRLPEPDALGTIYREPDGAGWILTPRPDGDSPDLRPWKSLDTKFVGAEWDALETGGRITSPGETDEPAHGFTLPSESPFANVTVTPADLAENAAGIAQIADNRTTGDMIADLIRGARESARLTNEAALTPCTDDAPCTACQTAPQTAVAETPEPTLLAAVIEDADGYVLIRQTSLPEPERAPWRRATTDPSEALHWYADLPQPVTVLDAGIDLSEPVCGESCDGTCDEPEGEEPSIGALLAEVAANALTIAAMKGITALTDHLLPEPEEETGETCEDPACCQQDEPTDERPFGWLTDAFGDFPAMIADLFGPELDATEPTTPDRPADRITPADVRLDETLDKVKAAVSEPACPHGRPGCKGGADCLTLAEYLSDAASPMVTNVFVAHEPTAEDLAQTIANAMRKGPTAQRPGRMNR